MDSGGWNDVSVVWRRWGSVWVILLAVTSTLRTVEGQENIAKACPGGSEDSPPVEVTLACPEGKVISLGEAKFGRSKYAQCTITDGDCLDDTDAFEACEGRHNCTVHFDRPFSPSCGYATFITVTYDCQTVTSTSPPTVPTPTHHVSRPASTVTTTTRRTSTEKDKTRSQDNNTGLIVGCAVAVIVTIILLIIAIIMVVRRLACGAELSDDEEKKSSACTIFPCVQVEQGENESKPRQDEANSHDNVDNEDKSSNKRKRKHRGRWADKNQNMSPRLAPVGQEDEEESSTPQNRTVAEAARASVYSEVGAAGGSARSSVAMEPSAQVKRHSSGARSAGSDIVKEQGGEISDVDDFSRRGGGEGRRAKRGIQTQGRGVGSSGSGDKMSTTSFSAPGQDRPPGSRMQKPVAERHSGKVPTQHHQFDAIAVPNTETFTAC